MEKDIQVICDAMVEATDALELAVEGECDGLGIPSPHTRRIAAYTVAAFIRALPAGWLMYKTRDDIANVLESF